MRVRVWVGGEGVGELGRDKPGAVEALLRRVRATGWHCEGKTIWSQIRKYRSRGARVRHADYANACSLALMAFEAGVEIIAFVRDVDSDEDREDAIAEAIRWIEHDSGWPIDVIGGVAKPALEGWILALRGHHDTDEMSRARTRERLDEASIELKSHAHYIEIIEAASLGPPPSFDLPPGTASLQQWLAKAHEVLNRVIDGRPNP
jgi:hypothetical protein